MARTPRIVYLFTTFPVRTETFLQREVRAMRQLGQPLELYSLWKGQGTFESLPVLRFNKLSIVAMLWWLPYWLWRKPGALRHVVRALMRRRIPSMLNLAENFIGLCYGLVKARSFERNPPDWMHATWATMPASAAWLIHQLTGIRYSLGAHAYDVFDHGGDWLLSDKLQDAAWVRTSSDSTRARLMEILAGRQKSSTRVELIRRGLETMPEVCPIRSPRATLRLLSIGRLVEKKGYPEQFAIYKTLRDQGFTFECRICGDGPLRSALERRLKQLGLKGSVTLMGHVPAEAIQEQFEWADVFVFTGKVARSGDRDGLPNVIPEAMARGIPVVSTPVGGAPEAVTSGENGILADAHDFATWETAFTSLQQDEAFYKQLSQNGRKWVETHFDVFHNSSKLLELIHREIED